MHYTVPITRSTFCPSSTVPCELNPIERVWAALKLHLRKEHPGSATALRKCLPNALHTAVPATSWGRYFRRSFRVASAYRMGCSFALAEYACRKYKSQYRAIPSNETVDKMLNELEHSRPEIFKRVTRGQAAKAEGKQQAEDLKAVEKKTVEKEFHPAMWQGLTDDCDDEEQCDEQDGEGKREKEAVVVLSTEHMSVSKPQQVGDDFMDSMAAEAAGVTRRLRRKAPVSYTKERLGLAWSGRPQHLLTYVFLLKITLI